MDFMTEIQSWIYFCILAPIIIELNTVNVSNIPILCYEVAKLNPMVI